MRMLTERDAAALLSVTAELATLDDADPFPPHFLHRLAKLFGTRNAAYSELDRGRRRTLQHVWWEDGDGGSDRPEHETPVAETYWRLCHQHPTCGYRDRSGDYGTPYKVSDFVSLREFRRTEIWNELYREYGINYWLDVGLRPTGRLTRALIFSETRRDFGERDRLVLDLLRPHLQARFDRVQRAARFADELASLEGSDEPHHVLLCSGHGVIEFASAESRRLLSRYLRCTNGGLPESVATVLRDRPVAVERDGRRLTLRAAPIADLVVVLLGEEDLRLERLTRRQRTILEHVARGDTDAEIAAALGIAPATVSKHLERIYERLGVHTRTAAAALVRS